MLPPHGAWVIEANPCEEEGTYHVLLLQMHVVEVEEGDWSEGVVRVDHHLLFVTATHGETGCDGQLLKGYSSQ